MTRNIWMRRSTKPAMMVSGKFPSNLENEPGSDNGKWTLIPWLVGAIVIFGLLYSISHIALLSLPKHEGMNMRSQLAADYYVWESLAFQPVDPAIIEEIQLERDLPGQVVIVDPSWPTPVVSLPSLSTTHMGNNSTPQGTPDQAPIDPTETPPSSTLTPIPTDTVLHPTSTETPQVSLPRPTKTRKPHKTPKPPKPGKTP